MKPRLLWLAVGLILVLGGLDFVQFLGKITQPPRHNTEPADAIAVLTGARERIKVAAHLLADGKGQRLLISGVNERIHQADILRIDPVLETRMDCCIDLGRKATNTIGNAQEVAAWARSKHYESLWLVTSDYHMPRAILELHHAAPGLTLYPWPVASAREGELPSLADSSIWRLILSEWIKLQIVRLRIASGLSMTDTE